MYLGKLFFSATLKSYCSCPYVKDTAQKMKFPIKEFFSKCDQIYRRLRKFCVRTKSMTPYMSVTLASYGSSENFVFQHGIW